MSARFSSPSPEGFHTIGREHIEAMSNGAILANSGHFNVEIDIPALQELAVSHREVRSFVEEYTMGDGRKIYLLAEGRLINLSAAEGHPSAVMDMSFANQACPWNISPRTGEVSRRAYTAYLWISTARSGA